MLISETLDDNIIQMAYHFLWKVESKIKVHMISEVLNIPISSENACLCWSTHYKGLSCILYTLVLVLYYYWPNKHNVGHILYGVIYILANPWSQPQKFLQACVFQSCTMVGGILRVGCSLLTELWTINLGIKLAFKFELSLHYYWIWLQNGYWPYLIWCWWFSSLLFYYICH